MAFNVDKVIASMKGIAGSGNVLSRSIKYMQDFLMTMEPGDIVRSNPPLASSVPIAYDLWYLWCNDNFMRKYFATDIDGDHYDYSQYMSQNLDFLNYLTGLKPLKIFRDLQSQLSEHTYFDVYDMTVKTDWTNNGIYWINALSFEMWRKDLGPQYPSDGPKDFDINNYVGYLSIPVGQLGVMQVISVFQETELNGYKFMDVDTNALYWPKLALNYEDVEDKNKIAIQSPTDIFPKIKDDNGNAIGIDNGCFGRHLIEGAYLRSNTPIKSQNNKNYIGETAYGPTPSRDVEICSPNMDQYPENVKPKLWMRYWIHKDDILPVPGEFIGILCKPVTCPAHVWWFQESSPFLYSGNWVETGNLTSGVVKSVTSEINRTDGGIGPQYLVRVQGCDILIDSSDFFPYAVGDRVAVLKIRSVNPASASFTWINQSHLKDTDMNVKKTNYVIIPATFYKIKT